MRVIDIICSINAKKIGFRSSSPASRSAMKDGLCIRGMIHDTWLRQHLHPPSFET
jgi:2-methylcitrate dehydratase PrpD